jgi:hypothetical protein
MALSLIRNIIPEFYPSESITLGFLLTVGTFWLLSSLPQMSGILLFDLDHALILQVRIMTMGSSALLDSVFNIA